MAATDAVSALKACVEEAGADEAEKALCREYATEELTLTSDSASSDSVEREPGRAPTKRSVFQTTLRVYNVNHNSVLLLSYGTNSIAL